jgi:plastocyanin
MVMKFQRALMVCIAAASVACGSSSPTSPSNSGGSGGSGGTGGTGGTGGNPPVATTTITITAAGVSPQRITVAPGTRVTFINNDTRSHEINSDQHPSHGECPAIDDIGFIAVGQTKMTGNLNVVRTCGYHEHNLVPAPTFAGQIIVQ